MPQSESNSGKSCARKRKAMPSARAAVPVCRLRSPLFFVTLHQKSCMDRPPKSHCLLNPSICKKLRSRNPQSGCRASLPCLPQKQPFPDKRLFVCDQGPCLRVMRIPGITCPNSSAALSKALSLAVFPACTRQLLQASEPSRIWDNLHLLAAPRVRSDAPPWPA